MVEQSFIGAIVNLPESPRNRAKISCFSAAAGIFPKPLSSNHTGRTSNCTSAPFSLSAAATISPSFSAAHETKPETKLPRP